MLVHGKRNTEMREGQAWVLEHLEGFGKRARVLIAAMTLDAAVKALYGLQEVGGEGAFTHTLAEADVVEGYTIAHKGGGTVSARSLADPRAFDGLQWSVSWILMSQELADFARLTRASESVSLIAIGTRLEPGYELRTEVEGRDDR